MGMEEIAWPATTVAYAYQMIAAARRPLLERCVFSSIATPESDALKRSNVSEPDLSIPLTNGVKLVGWMHPGLAGASALVRDPDSGEMVMQPAAEWEGAEAALIREEFPRLCRGGSSRLTFP